MSNIVNIIFLEEIESDDPRAWTDDLIYPFTVLQDIHSLVLTHHDLALLLDSLLVS